MPWGGSEMYYEDKKARGFKEFDFSIRNTKGELFYGTRNGSPVVADPS